MILPFLPFYLTEAPVVQNVPLGTTTTTVEIRYAKPSVCIPIYPVDKRGREIPVSKKHPLTYECSGGCTIWANPIKPATKVNGAPTNVPKE